MTGNAYLILTLVGSCLAMIGNDCLVFTLKGSSLPHATLAGWEGYISVGAGLHCLLDWVLKGHLFSSLPLATRGWECYMVDFGCGCQVRDLKKYNA